MISFKRRYPGISFWENFLGEHITIGPITIYGENAMHWGVNIHTKRWGFICFRLPFRSFEAWWPLYFYVSSNATPWASTFYRGPDNNQRIKSVERRKKYGHNFNDNLLYPDR